MSKRIINDLQNTTQKTTLKPEVNSDVPER